jgi:hypothetical protein
MLDRLRTNAADALLALALAIALELQVVLGGEPGAAPASVVAALAITVPLAWRRTAPLALVLAYAAVSPLEACSAASCSWAIRRWPARSRPA